MQDLYTWLGLFNEYGWFGLVILLEYLFPNRRYALLNKGWISDLLHTYEPVARAMLINACVVGINGLLPATGLLKNLLAGAPGWQVFLMALLVSEVSFYFIHRMVHRNPILWEFHRVHHSSTRYYSLMTSRFHLFDLAVFSIPYVVIMGWLGAGGEGLVWFAFFQGFVDRYGHSNVNGPRFTGYVLMTPHFHAWHHSTDKAAYDTNFSRDLVVLDYLFGTAYYPKGKEAAGFGEEGYSNNYFIQQLAPFYYVAKKARQYFHDVFHPAADSRAARPD